MWTSVFESRFALACATILMALSVPAHAAKPTKPGTDAPDPCENMNQPGALFPSHVFTRPVGQRVANWGIFVADETGKCERLVSTYSGADGGVVGKTLDLWVSGSTNLIVGYRRGFAIEALSFSISFDSKGIPTISTTGFNDILLPVDLPVSSSAPTDWQTTYVFDPKVSPDGENILLIAYDQNLGATITWVCAFDSSLGPGPVSDCRSVYYDAGPETAATVWGVNSRTLYYTDQARSGSGNSVYRMTLPNWNEYPDATVDIDEVWSRGTLFREVRAGQVGVTELLAVSEVSPAGDGCHRVYVVDVGSCPSAGCDDTDIVNGAGHPARWGGWLPNGKVLAEGQSAPSRKGGCAATNKVVTFEYDDLGGNVTVLSDGYQPDGAGSG